MKDNRARRRARPGPALLAALRGLARLPARIWAGMQTRAEVLAGGRSQETDPELANLWLALLAADPDGSWYAWPGTVRRVRHDDTRPE